MYNSRNSLNIGGKKANYILPKMIAIVAGLDAAYFF